MNTDHPSISIRRGRPEDSDVLAEFNIQMARETEHLELIPEVIHAGVLAVLRDPSRGFYLVAESNSQICGALMVTCEWSDWRNGFFWWIQSVFVRPESRRQGVYRMLHESLLEEAKITPEVCGLRLYVERENHRAQQTYTRLGMQETHYQLYEQLKPNLRFLREPS